MRSTIKNHNFTLQTKLYHDKHNRIEKHEKDEIREKKRNDTFR